MKRMFMMFLALLVVVVFSFGCTVSKDAKVKCPKCGAVFTVEEGLADQHRK